MGWLGRKLEMRKGRPKEYEIQFKTERHQPKEPAPYIGEGGLELPFSNIDKLGIISPSSFMLKANTANVTQVDRREEDRRQEHRRLNPDRRQKVYLFEPDPYTGEERRRGEDRRQEHRRQKRDRRDKKDDF